ncbi:hypothetical protein PISMIDRAFT_10520 [Pisolithus microcarpus 441]|uniref:Protein transport protein SEC23 n=1 Tax=Pisolithus microcarpus 441 TaxID=765257 RepID=A0A0C9ZNI7_9AGAM|nr:hypothetical protein PISMIDRAFT_10520 [Pisolithus microcarpus 441]
MHDHILAALKTFHDHKHAIIGAGLCCGQTTGAALDHWDIPKLEFMQSVTPSIPQTGIVIQWSANTTKHAHIEVIKDLVTTMNNQNYDSQICCTLDRNEKCCLFNTAISLSKQTNIHDTLAGDDSETDAPDHGDQNMPDSAGDNAIDNILHDLWSSDRSPTCFFNSAEKLSSASPGSAPMPLRTLVVGCTALRLNYKLSIRHISINEVADNFNLPDLHGALDDQGAESFRGIRHATSAGKKSACVGETEIDVGQTSEWGLNTIALQTSAAVYFEMLTPARQALQLGSWGLIQFMTHYQHSSGQQRLCVTTIACNFAEVGSPSITALFDQEAADLMARITVFETEIDNPPARFADYRREDPTSFRLSDNFSIYPQFMFHLWRSQFLQAFDNSPDETAFNRHILNEEDVNSSLITFQPTLMSFKFDVPPQPVLLNSVSIKPDIILPLDMFFHIHIFHGETVAQWREAGYQDQEGYETCKELLEARDLLINCFPLPRARLLSSPRHNFDSPNLANTISKYSYSSVPYATTSAGCPYMPPDSSISPSAVYNIIAGGLLLDSLNSDSSQHAYTAAVPHSYHFNPIDPPATCRKSRTEDTNDEDEDFQHAAGHSSATDSRRKIIHKQWIE